MQLPPKTAERVRKKYQKERGSPPRHIHWRVNEERILVDPGEVVYRYDEKNDRLFRLSEEKSREFAKTMVGRPL